MQHSHTRRFRSLVTPVLLLSCISAVLAQQPVSSPIQATMRQFFQTLTTIFPLSLQDKDFQDPAQRSHILETLQTLASHAEHLELHGQQVSLSFDFLRRSLAREASQVAEAYAEGKYSRAQFMLHQLTERCFACHSRLPNTRQFDLGATFLERMPLQQLPLGERVRLAVATRQFDTALEMYETLFRSTDLSASEIDLKGAFEDYLKIAIRVRQDFARAQAALKQFQQRPDVPRYLHHILQDWLETLQTLQTDRTNALARARTLIREGQQRNRYPADRRGLIHFMVASSLLNRYVEAARPDAPELAEAYYLLGLTESYVSRSFWLPETAFFLETAIHLAPDSAVAKQAYVFLEEYITVGFTGSAGTHIPPDVQTHLDELRALLHHR